MSLLTLLVCAQLRSGGAIALRIGALALFASIAAAQRGPIPLDKNYTNRDDGVTWLVEGRQRIRSNVKLTSLRACTIVAVGEGAVLEIEGSLDLRAATGGEIVIDGVWIEPLPGCKGVTLMNGRFEGAGGLRSAEGEPVDAELTFNATKFLGKSKLDLGMIGGKLVIMGCSFSEPAVLRGLTSEKQVRNSLEVLLVGCYGGERGFNGGLSIEGVKEVTVRNVDVGGAECKLVDSGKLAFDGNRVRSRRVEIRQSQPKSFGTTKIASNDFTCKELLLIQPLTSGDPQKVRLESCWFDDQLEAVAIKTHMLSDFEKDPTNGVLATFSKIQPAPLGFAGGAR